MPITTKLWQRRTPNSVLLRDWKLANLEDESLVKPVISTVLKADLGKTVGQLSSQDIRALRLSLANVLGFHLTRKPAEAPSS